MLQISAITSKKLRPDFAISEGLVVTPSNRPVAARSPISLTSAVSAKNFMESSLSDWRYRKGSAEKSYHKLDRKQKSGQNRPI
jgi:hypothetical protein